MANYKLAEEMGEKKRDAATPLSNLSESTRVQCESFDFN